MTHGSKARYLAELEQAEVAKFDRNDTLLATGTAGIGGRLGINRGIATYNERARSKRVAAAEAMKARAEAMQRPTRAQAQARFPRLKPAEAESRATKEFNVARNTAMSEASRARKEGLKLVKITPRMGKAGKVATTLTGIGGLYGGLRGKAEPVRKFTTRDVDSGAAGALAGGLAYQGVGYGPYKHLKGRAERKIKSDPDLLARAREYAPPKVPQGHPAWKGYWRNYPTELPGGGAHRVFARSHGGKTGAALTGLSAVGAGLGAIHVVNKAELPKYAVHKVAKLGKMQVLGMHSKDHFLLLDKRDNRRIVHRDLLTFINKRDNRTLPKPLKTSISEGDAKRLVREHGLKGPLPKHLNREQKMAAYEARYVSAGGKKAEHWNHRAREADVIRGAGLAGATVGSAAWTAGRLKGPGKALKAVGRVMGKPHVQHHAETAIGASAAVGGAGELYAGHARRKRSSYASSPAGVAASALRRMQDYTPRA